MRNLEKKISRLSPEKREVLLKKLKEKGLITQQEYEIIKPREDQTEYPMSFAQERLWFLNQLNPDSPFYNIPAAIKIKGELNINAFIKAFEKVVARHEILNVIFKSENEGPVQYLQRNNKRAIDVIDFSTFDTKTQSSQLKAQINKLSGKPFNLSDGPLLRASLITLAGNENVFIICFHHIIADGWSIGVFINDLLSFYNNELNGNYQNLLEPLDIQYFDFSFWQKQKLEKGEFNTQLDFWKKELKDMPELLNLPVDNPRKSIQTFNGKNYEFKIPGYLKQKLVELSKTSKSSIFMILLAAFQILLRRYSGQKDFGIGIPAANRNHPQIKNLIGFFVNSLVIRSNIDLDLTFSVLLEIVKEKVLKANENQDIPFEKIVESLGTKKDISHTPLFQVMFDFQVNPLNHINLPGIKLEILKPEVNSAKFDLLLLIEDSKDEFACSLEYNSDLFNSESIANLSTSFLTLLENIVSAPSIKLKYQKIITNSVFERIVKDFNGTYKKLPLNLGIHNYFEKQVKKNPDKIAIEFGDKSLTYKDLNGKANQLACYLKAKGIKPESTVGIALERSFEQIISVIATVKCGAVYVPIDTSYPPERISYMLKDSRISLLIKARNTHLDFSDEEISELDINTIENELKQYPTGNLKVDITPDNVIYIMYTSGSTGVPKGVTVLHSGVIRLVKQDNFGNMNNQNILALSSFSFDASTLEIWGSLSNGSKLVLHQSGQTSLSDISKVIREKKISFIWLTAGLFNAMVEENLDDLIQVKQILTGGEVLSVPHVNKVLSRFNDDQILVNGYGPTENTTFTACLKMLRGNEFRYSIPIGYPIKNTQVYILNESFNIQPVGVIGELCIGGLGLARGYHNSPYQTAEKFIPNQYSTISGDRLYRTGDLAKFNSKGEIEFVGRIDNQVKLRGFRIELGEIESVLREHEIVDNCTVIFSKNDIADAHLIAYLKFNSSNKIGIDHIKQYLSEKLPEHMIPAKFVEVDKFYLTANGKIDKSKLPSEQKLEEKKQFISPRNDLEKYLINLWKEVLQINNISVYDDFFELGGNSLKAAILINRIQKDFNRETHVGVIFKAPKVAEFATYMLEYYPNVVKENFNLDSEFYSRSKTLLSEESEEIIKISSDSIEKFKNIIKVNHSKFEQSYKKNPKAVFILSPPRSGSTLLRVMLAGNEKLFSPPELDLLSFDSLKQRNDFFRDKGFDIWLESIIRAVMELKKYNATKAEEFINELEKKNVSTIEFYGLMQEWLGNKLLVDKTPSYAMDYDLLERAEENFDKPIYIHLVRHPYAMIYSFIEAKLDEQFFKYNHNFTRRELAELIWLVSNQNIIKFSNEIPDDRIIQIKFEDLVYNPEEQLRSLCNFMGIEFSYRMLDVYKGNKMTDAVKKNSQMVGDFKFYLHSKIDISVINRWKNYHKNDFLSKHALNIAAELNYKIEDTVTVSAQKINTAYASIEKISREDELPLSFAQQRLWFLEQLEPGNATYNIPGVVRIHGSIRVEVLEKSINAIIKRHESLRTIFLSEEGKAKQFILPELRIHIDVDEVTGLDDGKLNDKTTELIKIEAKIPFDLSKGPLIRSRLLKLNKEDHILIITTHHIISDGWSLDIFVKELFEFYRAYYFGKQPRLKELPIQYVDFAAWQRIWLKGEIFNYQINYWKNKLHQLPPLLELPTDYPRPAFQSQNGKRIEFEIDTKMVKELMQLGLKENATIYIILLTTFNILLKKYTYSNDIVLGTPVAGRNRKEIEPLIGFFVNTLVLRNDLSGDPVFKHLVQSVKQSFIEALNHQDIPFEKLVDELNIERTLSHSPLFQVLFVFNNSPLTKIELENISLQPMTLDLGTAKFDVTMALTRKDERIKGVIEFNSDLFRENTIRRMISHYQNLLKIITKNPVKHISQLSIITDEEKFNLINNLYSAEKYTDITTNILDVIAEQSMKYAKKTAIVFEGNSVSYAEFNSRTNRLARYLEKKGVQQEELVAVCLDRSFEMLYALHGIIKAGGAYLPIDPSNPEDRINYILKDSGAKIILTDKINKTKISSNDCKIIELDKIENELMLESGDYLEKEIELNNIIYCLYTSGSTGKPKGTLVQHLSVINNLLWMKDEYGFDESDIIMQKTPYTFDVSVWELFIPFMCGATLVIAKPEGHKDSVYIKELVKKEKITSIHFVPALLQVFIEEAGIKEYCKTLKRIIVSGEDISYDLQSRYYEILEVPMHNLYGPTEATVHVSYWECSTSVDLKSVPMGKPIWNTQLYVLDENFEPVPIGVEGELYIGGLSLARGYLNRFDLTAERFIPDPYSKRIGMRMYKTGDIVKCYEDGVIDYIGRIDNQVKIRGFRVELGEIETLLNAHKNINKAIVIAFNDEQRRKRLVAYIVVSDKEPSIRDLHDYLKEVLPNYMIPSVFMFIDELPLTPSGKINRGALPEPAINRDKIDSEFILAATDTEKILADIWKEVLKLEEIGVLDNFFELGGDSILGIQIIAKANERGVRLSPKNLFEAPTIKGLANIVKKTQKVVAEQGIIEGKVPLTPIQKWFFEMELENPNHWNQSILLDVNETLDEEKLKEAIWNLMELHDVLRMRYQKLGKVKYEQYFADKLTKVPFTLEDIEFENQEKLEKIISEKSEEYQESLNIEEGPIFRLVYFKISGSGSDKLLIVIHHLVVDGVSWRILMKDLQESYEQLLKDERKRLPLKTTSFKYWSEKLIEYAKRAEIVKEVEYWTRLGRKEELVKIPVDKVEGENNEGSIENEKIIISKEETKKIQKELPKKLKAEIVEIILTAFMQALTNYTGRRKQIIGMEGHGREDIFEDVDISRTMGWFTTYYPVMFDFKDSIKIVDRLKLIKEEYRKIPQKGLGYGVLKYLSEEEEVSTRMREIPEPEIVINYLGVFNQEEEEMKRFSISKEKKGHERGKKNKRAHLIEVSASIINGELNIVIMYSKEKHKKETIEELLKEIEVNLIQLVETIKTEKEIEYSAVDFEEAEITDDDLGDLLLELDE